MEWGTTGLGKVVKVGKESREEGNRRNRGVRSGDGLFTKERRLEKRMAEEAYRGRMTDGKGIGN